MSREITGIGPDTSFLNSLLTNWAARIAGAFTDTTGKAAQGSAPPALALPAGAASFQGLIESAASRHDLPADLLRAVIQAESGFNPRAVSAAGAKGLMQLMDATARGLGVQNPFDPAQNIEGGATYLKNMLDHFGNVRLALAAYNAGPGAVEHYGGVPPYAETQRYVQRVLALAGLDREA